MFVFMSATRTIEQVGPEASTNSCCTVTRPVGRAAGAENRSRSLRRAEPVHAETARAAGRLRTGSPVRKQTGARRRAGAAAAAGAAGWAGRAGADGAGQVAGGTCAAARLIAADAAPAEAARAVQVARAGGAAPQATTNSPTANTSAKTALIILVLIYRAFPLGDSLKGSRTECTRIGMRLRSVRSARRAHDLPEGQADALRRDARIARQPMAEVALEGAAHHSRLPVTRSITRRSPSRGRRGMITKRRVAPSDSVATSGSAPSSGSSSACRPMLSRPSR